MSKQTDYAASLDGPTAPRKHPLPPCFFPDPCHTKIARSSPVRFPVFLATSRGKKSVVERECFRRAINNYTLSVSSHPRPTATVLHPHFSPLSKIPRGSLVCSLIVVRQARNFRIVPRYYSKLGTLEVAMDLSNEPIVSKLSRCWRCSIRNGKVSRVEVARVLR